MADRREELRRRAEEVRLRWGWPERLALAGLGALLAGAALPWGTDAAALPLWLGQASSPGTALMGIALAAFAVPARTVAAWRWDRLHVVVGLAGAVAGLGATAVQDVDGEPLPFLVPGRIVLLAGGITLVAAAGGMAWVSAARGRAESWAAGARWQALASDATAVDRVLAESRAEARQPGWVGAALVAVGAGALALVGPWWRALVDVRGPYVSWMSEPALDSGDSAPTVRSGIELLGPAWSWAVAAAVLLATAVATDGRGGAWWLELVAAPAPIDQGSPMEVRLVHLLASGAVVRDAAPVEVGPGPGALGLWADGDVAYVLGADVVSRVEGDRVDVVAEGPDADVLDGRYDQLMATRSGDLVARIHRSDALVRLLGGRWEPLLGPTPSAGPSADADPNAAPDDLPRRSLAVEIAMGLPPSEVHIDGSAVPDPAGDGVLVLQDGLLVRVALDGTITPLAQDPQLEETLRVVDGRLIVAYDGRSFTMEVPG